MHLKFKNPFHSPSWHHNGQKYKVGSWGRLSIGDNMRLKWRSGWRQHEHEHYNSGDDDYRSGNVSTLLRPPSSARVFFNNQARGDYG